MLRDFYDPDGVLSTYVNFEELFEQRMLGNPTPSSLFWLVLFTWCVALQPCFNYQVKTGKTISKREIFPIYLASFPQPT